MTPVKEIKLLVPKKIYDKLEELEKRLGVSKEDIVLRAIMKVIEEMG
ncbi:MAG: hypothetical protein DRJ03_28085 [Chloroflexi bacterium]|nr:MAG: hypothetical protein DRJ03_28085 [Chloroflexota bacterium]